MDEKQRLEATILRSFLEFPDKMDEFLSVVDFKVFGEFASEILNEMLVLKDKGTFELVALNASVKPSLKASPFYIEFLSAQPSVLVLKLADTLIKSYKIQMQKKLADTLERASNSGEILDLEHLQKEMSVNVKTYLTLRQWIEYYAQKPKAIQLKTGVDFLDTCFNGGVELGQLILIGGDPEAGKTQLGLQIIEYIARARKVAFFSFEFTIESYLKRLAEKNIRVNEDGIIILNDGYNIFEMSENIHNLYKMGVRVFFIDSQMRITNSQGRNMEEEESAKFSILARLCHSLGIAIFLVVQNSKGDKENPMGSKKGGHEASIIIRIERNGVSKDDIMQRGREYDEFSRTIIVQKNKQTGKHIKEVVEFSPETLRFKSLYNLNAQKVGFNEKADKEVSKELQ